MKIGPGGMFDADLEARDTLKEISFRGVFQNAGNEPRIISLYFLGIF